MNTVTNQEMLQHYFKQIRSLFPTYGGNEKRFLADFKKSVSDFVDNAPDATFEEILSEFGDPKEIIKDYMNDLDIDNLMTRIRLSKAIRIAVALLVLIALLMASTILAMQYQLHKDAREAIIAFEDIEIIEEP